MKPKSNEQMTLQEIEQIIINKISYYCKIDNSRIDPVAPLEHIALDSIIVMTIVEELKHELAVDLPTFIFYENETLRDSAKMIIELMESSGK
jgi:acyl carrier protein